MKKVLLVAAAAALGLAGAAHAKVVANGKVEVRIGGSTCGMMVTNNDDSRAFFVESGRVTAEFLVRNKALAPQYRQDPNQIKNAIGNVTVKAGPHWTRITRTVNVRSGTVNPGSTKQNFTPGLSPNTLKRKVADLGVEPGSIPNACPPLLTNIRSRLVGTAGGGGDIKGKLRP